MSAIATLLVWTHRRVKPAKQAGVLNRWQFPAALTWDNHVVYDERLVNHLPPRYPVPPLSTPPSGNPEV